MDKNNNFGLKLCQIRKSKNLTQAKLAELAGVHEKHISKLELGTYTPNFKTLNKIFKALDLNYEDISNFNNEQLSAHNSPFYIKSLQILNNASDKELEYYYGTLKQAKKGIDILNS